MSFCHIFLHGGGAFGGKFVYYFEVVLHNVFLEGYAQFPAQGCTFLGQSDEGVAHLARFLYFAHRHVIVGSGDCHSGDERPLDECVPVDVVGDVGFDAALLQITLHGFQCFTGNNRAAVCPIDEAENLSHLRDFSPSRYKAYDVDATVEHRDAGDQTLDAGAGAVDIQNRDDYRMFVCGAFDEFRNGVYGIAFDADEDDICLVVRRC